MRRAGRGHAELLRDEFAAALVRAQGFRAVTSGGMRAHRKLRRAETWSAWVGGFGGIVPMLAVPATLAALTIPAIRMVRKEPMPEATVVPART